VVIVAKIKEPKGIRNTMVASLAEMRWNFRTYAAGVIHLSYDLRPSLFSSIDEATHKREKIPALLEELQYLESLTEVFMLLFDWRDFPLLILNLRMPMELMSFDPWSTKCCFTWLRIC
jgi:hypothetical protein